MKKCLVLLSTYNGDKFLKEQIDSILKQKDVEIDILVFDDCSSDNTLELLKSYSNLFNNIKFIVNPCNVGFAKNFMNLIYNASDNYDYYALADQDDFWFDNKIVSAINKIEANYEGPALYSSNLMVTDDKLRDLNLFWEIRPKIDFYSLSSENVCTGCTIVFNNSFRKLIKHVDDGIYLHDYWLCLIAKIYNCYIYDNNYYIKYRQHSNNQIGKQKKKKSIFSKIIDFNRQIFKVNINSQSTMFNVLLQEYSFKISNEDSAIIKRIANIKSLKNRLYVFISRKYKCSNFKQNVQFKIKALLGKL